VASVGVRAKWGNDRIGAFCGFVSGVLFFAAFSVSQAQFTMTGEQTLQSFSSYSPTAVATLVVFSLVLFFAVPFFLTLRDVLENQNRLFANAAVAFLVIGFAVTAASLFAQVAGLRTLADIYAQNTGARRDAAAVTAEAVLGLTNGLLILGLIALSTGVLLFGVLSRNSGRFPNWLAYVAILSAILGFVVFGLPFSLATLAAGIGWFFLLLVWMFASSAYLWRSGAMPASP